MFEAQYTVHMQWKTNAEKNTYALIGIVRISVLVADPGVFRGDELPDPHSRRFPQQFVYDILTREPLCNFGNLPSQKLLIRHLDIHTRPPVTDDACHKRLSSSRATTSQLPLTLPFELSFCLHQLACAKMVGLTLASFLADC